MVVGQALAIVTQRGFALPLLGATTRMVFEHGQVLRVARNVCVYV